MPPSVGQKPLPFPLPRLRENGLMPDIAWPTILLAATFFSLNTVSLFYALQNPTIVDLSADAATAAATTTTAAAGNATSYSSAPKRFSLRMSDDFSFDNNLSYWVAFAIRALCSYVLFTSMHDSSHGSVAPRNKILNDIVGLVSGLGFGAPYFLFVRIHLEHHKYVNQEEDEDFHGDPDLPTGGGAWEKHYQKLPPGVRHLYLILRCAALPLFYLLHVLLYDLLKPPKARVSAAVIARDLSIYFALIAFPIFIAPFTQNFTACFYLWAMPNFVAYSLLGLFFDFLPHRPHHSTDLVLATSLVTLFPTRTDGLTRKEIFEHGSIDVLTFPLLSQNFHVLHHLAPSVPFYLYKRALFETETSPGRCLFDDLAQEGLRAYPLLPVFHFEKETETSNKKQN